MLFLIYYKLFMVVILKMFCLQIMRYKAKAKSKLFTNNKHILNLFFLSIIKDFIKYLLNIKK